MRDDKIYQMRNQEIQRFQAMVRQLLFVQTRMESFEEVISKRWNVLRGILSPSWLIKKVDEVQLARFKEHDEKVKAAQEKAKESISNKISIVSANGLAKLSLALLVVSMLGSGCVSRKFHNSELKRIYAEGFEAADFQCIQIQKKISEYTNSLVLRLRKFNQIDSKGNLYPEKPIYNSREDDSRPGEGS